MVEQWVKSAGSQELSAEDLAVVLQWLKAVANQEAGRASAPASNSGYSSGSDSAGVDSTGTLDSAGIESRGTPVPVELTETNPFPGAAHLLQDCTAPPSPPGAAAASRPLLPCTPACRAAMLLCSPPPSASPRTLQTASPSV